MAPLSRRWLLPDHEDVLSLSMKYREGELEAIDGELVGEDVRGALEGLSETQQELEEWEPDLPTNFPVGVCPALCALCPRAGCALWQAWVGGPRK